MHEASCKRAASDRRRRPCSLLGGTRRGPDRTEIHFWHAMGGQLGETVNELVRQFNQSQGEYEVKALNKGTYPEVLTSAIAAYRQETAAHRAGLRGGHPDHAPAGAVARPTS